MERNIILNLLTHRVYQSLSAQLTVLIEIPRLEYKMNKKIHFILPKSLVNTNQQIFKSLNLRQIELKFNTFGNCRSWYLI